MSKAVEVLDGQWRGFCLLYADGVPGTSYGLTKDTTFDTKILPGSAVKLNDAFVVGHVVAVRKQPEGLYVTMRPRMRVDVEQEMLLDQPLFHELVIRNETFWYNLEWTFTGDTKVTLKKKFDLEQEKTVEVVDRYSILSIGVLYAPPMAASGPTLPIIRTK